MKITSFRIVVLALLVFVAAAIAAERRVERYSTDPGKDLERVSVKGKVESIDGQLARLKADDGRTYQVHLGPRAYWRDKGYHLESGVYVTVDGWAGDDDEIFAGGIYGDGFTIEISDSEGYPRWADRDDYDDEWCPRLDVIRVYYFGGPPPWAHRHYWGPRPWWTHYYDWRPPRHHPPRYDYPRHDWPRYDNPRHDRPRHDPPPPPREHSRRGRSW
jgi:hypothetical protein